MAEEVPKTTPPQVPEKEEEELVKQTSNIDENDDVEKIPEEEASLKEESTKVSELPELEKKALEELKQIVREALDKGEFSCFTSNELILGEKGRKEEVAKEKEKEKEKKMDELEEKETKKVIEEDERKLEAGGDAMVVDDDGAKTVEAIEESVVAVSSCIDQDKKDETTDVDAKPDGLKEHSSIRDSHIVGSEEVSVEKFPQEEVSIWGIPLLADERSDVILLKFLRARDFKVNDAFTMIKNTIHWRKEFGIEELLLEDELGGDDHLKKVVFMHGFDKEGHPVCYNVYGNFQDKELYDKLLSDEEKRERFLRWRIRFLERSVRKLDFRPGGVSSILQVNDLKGFPGIGKKELRQATKQALQVLQDNYPEFLAKQVFINVPWWYLAFYKMISPFLTQRTRSKFVFAGPSKSAETLSRNIAAEQIPVKYGGLSKDGEFGTEDAITEIIIKPWSKQTVEFPVLEACCLTWEVRVVGWEVRYGAEFVPSAADSYTVIIQKPRRVVTSEGPVLGNKFKAGEPGKLVFSIENPTTKKKKLLYRLKTKSSLD